MAKLLTKRTEQKRSPQSSVHIMQRVFNTPLMIHRPKLDAILHVIGPRIGLSPNMIIEVDEAYLQEKREEPQKQVGPVAVIPVQGTLVKRGGYMDSMSGLTSYDSLRGMVQEAMDDPQVKTLLFDIDSPGGEAAGLFDFADWLTSLRGEKQMIGISNDAAYSAAYAIASCMDKLFVTSVGGVGSIGVYALHVDQSGRDRQNGLTFTYVQSGAKKTDGNPHEPLDKSALAEMQQHVDKIRDMFVSLVARNRSVDAKKIYDTEAALFMGEEGIPMLADGVANYDEVMVEAMSGVKAKRTIPVRLPDRELLDMNNPRKDLIMTRDFGTLNFVKTSASVLAEGQHVIDAPHGRISGVLAPYEVLSCDLGGFREVYSAGCFKKSLETGDPLLLAFHDPSKVLGRKSVGTARFWEEADGLHYEADLPDTQDARDLKVLIERGDVRGASAAFFIERYRWETRGGERVRVVEQAELVEGSPHSFTAYKDTTAGADQAASAALDELIGVRLRLLRQSI